MQAHPELRKLLLLRNLSALISIYLIRYSGLYQKVPRTMIPQRYFHSLLDQNREFNAFKRSVMFSAVQRSIF